MCYIMQPNVSYEGGQLPLQGALWQRHIASLGAFATAHVDEPPCTVNIGDLEAGAFLQPPATGVDGAQTDAIARQPHALEYRVHFVHTEDNLCLSVDSAPQKAQSYENSMELLASTRSS